MKRLVSVLVSLVLMVSCFSSALAAEDFTLRSGIKFGDTLEEVLDKEKTLTCESKSATGGVFNGKIAGYSGAKCIFSFDDDGKLIDMGYNFDYNICTSRDEMNSVYKKLYDSLKRQYGNPLGNTGDTLYLITGSAIEKAALIVAMVSSFDGYSADYIDYDEWVVDCDDYHVKIDIVSFYTRGDKYSYYVSLSYQCFTDEDYDAAVREKEGERQEVDDDL